MRSKMLLVLVFVLFAASDVCWSQQYTPQNGGMFLGDGRRNYSDPTSGMSKEETIRFSMQMAGFRARKDIGKTTVLTNSAFIELVDIELQGPEIHLTIRAKVDRVFLSAGFLFNGTQTSRGTSWMESKGVYNLSFEVPYAFNIIRIDGNQKTGSNPEKLIDLGG